MGTDSGAHDRRCAVCQRFFTPNPRLGDRQRLCGRKACRQQYKNQWQRGEYARNAQFRQKVFVRVRRWRWNHPGYSQRVACSGVDPPVSAVVREVSDTVLRLEYAVNGLASHTTGCRDREELRHVLARCVERGREVMDPGG
jgi:hypothetical protein